MFIGHDVLAVFYSLVMFDEIDSFFYGIFRVVKDTGISVTNASAAWFLQVLSATATASMTSAPNLRDTILQHSL